MGKTTIAQNIKKEVTFIGKRGTYRFDFSPDIGDVNKNPDKYQQYLVVRDDVATTPDPVQKENPEKNEMVVEGVKFKKENNSDVVSSSADRITDLSEIEINGVKYRKITGDEETIELNGVEYMRV
jgi:hypothetical protein